MNNKLQQPLMFILVGLPGSGKTYLTRQLAQKLRINSISAEQIRYTILDQPSLQKAEERLVRRIALFLVEELLKAGLAVICDLPAQSARSDSNSTNWLKFINTPWSLFINKLTSRLPGYVAKADIPTKLMINMPSI